MVLVLIRHDEGDLGFLRPAAPVVATDGDDTARDLNDEREAVGVVDAGEPGDLGLRQGRVD